MQVSGLIWEYVGIARGQGLVEPREGRAGFPPPGPDLGAGGRSLRAEALLDLLGGRLRRRGVGGRVPDLRVDLQAVVLALFRDLDVPRTGLSRRLRLAPHQVDLANPLMRAGGILL